MMHPESKLPTQDSKHKDAISSAIRDAVPRHTRKPFILSSARSTLTRITKTLRLNFARNHASVSKTPCEIQQDPAICSRPSLRHLLELPNEILISVLINVIPYSESSGHSRMNLLLSCKTISSLIEDAETAHVRELVSVKYACAAAIRPYTPDEEEAGLLFAWLPQLVALDYAVCTILGTSEAVPERERREIILGLYVIELLHDLADPIGHDWRHNVKKLPKWAAAAIRVASTGIMRSLDDSFLGNLHVRTDCGADQWTGHQELEYSLLEGGIFGSGARWTDWRRHVNLNVDGPSRTATLGCHIYQSRSKLWVLGYRGFIAGFHAHGVLRDPLQITRETVRICELARTWKAIGQYNGLMSSGRYVAQAAINRRLELAISVRLGQSGEAPTFPVSDSYESLRDQVAAHIDRKRLEDVLKELRGLLCDQS